MIKISNYSKRIKNDLVLDNISLELEQGRIYGFVGKNGSGKSMLFRAISGLIKPSVGEVIINDINITKLNCYPQNLGLFIDNVGFWPDYTGFENLKMLASIKNVADSTHIEETMLKVGLDPKDKRVFKKYSLGMKQKLGIAQAIMEYPQLLILDEPTNSLDQESVENIQKLILDFKSKNTTILLASHIREEIYGICDEVFTIAKGKIVGHEKL